MKQCLLHLWLTANTFTFIIPVNYPVALRYRCCFPCFTEELRLRKFDFISLIRCAVALGFEPGWRGCLRAGPLSVLALLYSFLRAAKLQAVGHSFIVSLAVPLWILHMTLRSASLRKGIGGCDGVRATQEKRSRGGIAPRGTQPRLEITKSCRGLQTQAGCCGEEEDL